MNKTLFITRPEHDDTTHYLSKWGAKTIEFALTKGINVLDLPQGRASKKEVESMLKKQNPSLVLFNGHGSTDTITGHHNEPIITINNSSILKNKIIYALSCCSAKRLGVNCVAQGAKTYIGYDDDFILVYEPEKITKPLTDDTAKLFLDPSNELTFSLIKGNTAEIACQHSKEAFKKNIQKLLSSEATEEDASLARYLWWDMQHQICLGDPNSSF